MKRGTKTVLYVVISILLVGIIFSTVDYFRSRSDKDPIFAIPFVLQKHDSQEYWGIGYKVIKCVKYSNFFSLSNSNHSNQPKTVYFGFYNMTIEKACSDYFVPLEDHNNEFELINVYKYYNIDDDSPREYKDNLIQVIKNKKDLETIKSILSKKNKTIQLCSSNRADGVYYDCLFNEDYPHLALEIIGEGNEPLYIIDLWVYTPTNLLILSSREIHSSLVAVDYFQLSKSDYKKLDRIIDFVSLKDVFYLAP